MSIQKIPKYDKQDINNVGVVSLAIRPNQPSQYGVGSLTGKQLQERFDKLATTAIDKINAVIEVLNGKDVAEYLRLGEAFGEDKSIKDMIADIYSATDGLVTTDPETAAKKAVNDILQDLYDGITDLEAFTEISNFDEGKKLSEIYATQAALTAHNTATDAHSDIRDSITTAISNHNTSADAHAEAIGAHNESPEAHTALRESITEAATNAATTVATTAVVNAISTHNEDEDAHSDIRTALTNLKTAVEHFLNIKDNDSLDQLSEIITYIENNKSLIDSITKSKVSVADIVNNLESNAENKPLSAKQGKVLRVALEECKAKSDVALVKFPNESGMKRLVALTANSGKGLADQTGIYAQTSVNDSATYESVPVRATSGKHKGTFEVSHPVMDANNTTMYSANHPVTVKTLIDYVAKHGGGTGYVKTEEFEAFKAQLLYKPIQILSFTAGDSSDTDEFEIGDVVNGVVLKWSTSTTPTTLLLDGVSQEIPKDATSGTINVSGNVSSYQFYTLKVSDNQTSATKNASIHFYNRVFYGVSTSATLTESEMKSLAYNPLTSTINSVFTIDTGTDKYIYYCAPENLGTCEFSYSEPGKNTWWSGGFNDFTTLTYTYKGVNTVYRVYRSTNKGFGRIDIKVT